MLLSLAVMAEAQVRTVAPPPVRIANGNVSTGFDPKIHGFRFTNDFSNDVVPVADIRTGGLCGGMSYTALDYYFSHMAVPIQDYRPANRTPLQSYIYNREVDSLTSNLDKWGEVGFNPGGARNSEFFNWGLQGTNGGASRNCARSSIAERRSSSTCRAMAARATIKWSRSATTSGVTRGT